MARILVLEDNPLNRDLMQQMLEDTHEVSLAVDGADGVQKAQELLPDLILTDLSMPGVDGFELIRTLRARGVELPIVVMSARDDRMDRMAAAAAGADSYLVKPFGLTELCSTVTALADAARDHGTLPV